MSAEHEGATKRNGARREDASDPVGVVLAKNRTLFFLLIVPSLSIFKYRREINSNSTRNKDQPMLEKERTGGAELRLGFPP